MDMSSQPIQQAKQAVEAEGKDAVPAAQALSSYTEAEVAKKALIPVAAAAIVSFALYFILCCFGYVGAFLGGVIGCYLMMRQFELPRMGDYQGVGNPFVKYAVLGCGIGNTVVLLVSLGAAALINELNAPRVMLNIFAFAVMNFASFIGAWVAYYVRNGLFPKK